MRSPFIAQNPACAIGLGLRLAAIKSSGAPGTNEAVAWSDIRQFRAEDRTVQDSFLIAGCMDWYHLMDRAELKTAFDHLQKNSVTNLFTFPASTLLATTAKAARAVRLRMTLGSCARPEFSPKSSNQCYRPPNEKLRT